MHSAFKLMGLGKPQMCLTMKRGGAYLDTRLEPHFVA